MLVTEISPVLTLLSGTFYLKSFVKSEISLIKRLKAAGKRWIFVVLEEPVGKRLHYIIHSEMMKGLNPCVA